MYKKMPFTTTEEGLIGSYVEDIYESPSVEGVILVVRDERGGVTSWSTEKPKDALEILLERAVDIAVKHNLKLSTVLRRIKQDRRRLSN
jgi:predicted nucleotidyltransferase